MQRMKHKQGKDNCFQMEVSSRKEESHRMNDFGTCQMKEEKAHDVGLTATFILSALRGRRVGEVER